MIEILDRLYFDPRSAQPHEAARPIVEAIAATIVGNPQLDKIGVVGGREAGEADALADERAAAVVQALVALGVPAARMEAHGHPRIISAEAGMNRAVWFVILRREGKDLRPASGDARWNPWDRDCPAKWKAFEERGEPMDCDCRDARPPH